MLHSMHETHPSPEDQQTTKPNSHRVPHGFIRRNAPYVAAGLLVAGVATGVYYIANRGESTPTPTPSATESFTPSQARCDKISASYSNDGRDWEASVVTTESGNMHIKEVHVIFDALNSKDEADVKALEDKDFGGIWEAHHTYKVPGEKMISAQVFTEGSTKPIICQSVQIETGDFDKDALGNPLP